MSALRLTDNQWEALGQAIDSQYAGGEISGGRPFSRRHKTCSTLATKGLLRRGPGGPDWSSFFLTAAGREAWERRTAGKAAPL